MLDTIYLFFKILLVLCIVIPAMLIGAFLLLVLLALLCKMFGIFGFFIFIALILTAHCKIEEYLFY